MLLLTILELYFNKDNLPENFLGSRTIGIIGGMIFIVVAFYTILGVLGQNYDFINIAIYFAGVIFALWLENKLYSKSYISNSTGTKILIFTTLYSFYLHFTLQSLDYLLTLRYRLIYCNSFTHCSISDFVALFNLFA